MCVCVCMLYALHLWEGEIPVFYYSAQSYFVPKPLLNCREASRQASRTQSLKLRQRDGESPGLLRSPPLSSSLFSLSSLSFLPTPPLCVLFRPILIGCLFTGREAKHFLFFLTIMSQSPLPLTLLFLTPQFPWE